MEGNCIRAILAANPFHPFTLGMLGKTRICVERPDFAEVSDDGDVLRLRNERGLCSVISIEHIASVTFDPPPPKPDVVVES